MDLNRTIVLNKNYYEPIQQHSQISTKNSTVLSGRWGPWEAVSGKANLFLTTHLILGGD